MKVLITAALTLVGCAVCGCNATITQLDSDNGTLSFTCIDQSIEQQHKILPICQVSGKHYSLTFTTTCVVCDSSTNLSRKQDGAQVLIVQEEVDTVVRAATHCTNSAFALKTSP